MTEGDPFTSPERYDDLWHDLLEGPQLEQAREWLKLLKGQTVLDLGSGNNTALYEQLLSSLGVVEYIPVEKESGKDMLESAKTLTPAGTYSISMNGINQMLIPAESDYAHALAEQIMRLLHPIGLVFGVGDGGILKALASGPKTESLFIPIDGVLSDTDNGFYFVKKKLRKGNT